MLEASELLILQKAEDKDYSMPTFHTEFSAGFLMSQAWGETQAIWWPILTFRWLTLPSDIVGCSQVSSFLWILRCHFSAGRRTSGKGLGKLHQQDPVPAKAPESYGGRTWWAVTFYTSALRVQSTGATCISSGLWAGGFLRKRGEMNCFWIYITTSWPWDCIGELGTVTSLYPL